MKRKLDLTHFGKQIQRYERIICIGQGIIDDTPFSVLKCIGMNVKRSYVHILLKLHKDEPDYYLVKGIRKDCKTIAQRIEDTFTEYMENEKRMREEFEKHKYHGL